MIQRFPTHRQGMVHTNIDIQRIKDDELESRNAKNMINAFEGKKYQANEVNHLRSSLQAL